MVVKAEEANKKEEEKELKVQEIIPESKEIPKAVVNEPTIGKKRKMEQMEVDEQPVKVDPQTSETPKAEDNTTKDHKPIDEQKDMSQDIPLKTGEEGAEVASPSKQQDNSNIEDKMEKIKLTDSDKKPYQSKRMKLAESEDRDIIMKQS